MAAAQVAQPPPASQAGQALGPLTDDEFRLPLEKDAAAEVDRILSVLGSPRYKEREEATQRLIEIGAPAFSRLRTAYRYADDLEVRLRVETIVRNAYLNHYVFDRNGFLGVSLAPLEPRDPKAPPRAEPENGVRIATVIPDTGASRARLRAGDVVTSLNGVAITGAGRDSIDRFSETIRQFRPDTKVRLAIVREGNPTTIDAVVGRCPEETARRGGVRFSPLYHQVSERFQDWWQKYFDPPQVAGSTDRP